MSLWTVDSERNVFSTPKQSSPNNQERSKTEALLEKVINANGNEFTMKIKKNCFTFNL